jgi:hypothetical protein
MGEKGVLTDADLGRQLQKTLDLTLKEYEQFFTGNAKIKASDPQMVTLTKGLNLARKRLYTDLNDKAMNQLKGSGVIYDREGDPVLSTLHDTYKSGWGDYAVEKEDVDADAILQRYRKSKEVKK